MSSLSWDELPLSKKHSKMLRDSGITPEVAKSRGYRTVESAGELRELGYKRGALSVPTLLVPLRGTQGEVWGYQHRPDSAVVDRNDKVLKYLSPSGQSNDLDINTFTRDRLDDPSVPLLITEGAKKADSAASAGFACISLNGVWSFKGKNQHGASVIFATWDELALQGRRVGIAYDSDVMTKPQVHQAMRRLAVFLAKRGATVEYVVLPAGRDGAKNGLDDWLAANPGADPWDHAREELPKSKGEQAGAGITDDALTQEWVAEFGLSNFRYMKTTRDWYVYTGAVWRSAGALAELDASIRRYLREKAVRALESDLDDQVAYLTSAGIQDRIIRIARSTPELFITDEDVDTQPFLLNVENGVLDLETGNLIPHDPALLLTQQSPTTFDPEAKCPQWTAFLDFALPEPEVRRYLQKMVGQALIGRVDEHVLPMLIGSGGNGKGVFIRALEHVLGTEQYVVEGDPGLVIKTGSNEHKTKIMTLRNKRLVFVTELDETDRFDAAQTKRLTGGDTLNARLMRQDEINFRPTHTLFLSTNWKPEVSATEEAIWRRIRLIPFLRKPENVDLALGRKLEAEASGILNWMLQGCLEWQREGLGEPLEVMAATAEYRTESDPIALFVQEAIKVTNNEDDVLSSDDVYSRYQDWCLSNGEPPMIRRTWAGHIGQAMGRKTVLKRVGGAPKKVWIGVAWVQESDGLRRINVPTGDDEDYTESNNSAQNPTVTSPVTSPKNGGLGKLRGVTSPEVARGSYAGVTGEVTGEVTQPHSPISSESSSNPVSKDSENSNWNSDRNFYKLENGSLSAIARKKRSKLFERRNSLLESANVEGKLRPDVTPFYDYLRNVTTDFSPPLCPDCDSPLVPHEIASSINVCPQCSINPEKESRP